MKRLMSVLKDDGVEQSLITVIRTILAASKELSFRISQGELSGILGSTLDENIQGEQQKALDVIANQLIKDLLAEEADVRSLASEEEEHIVPVNETGKYVIAFDPLDGSSNTDVNAQIGTIFTIFPARDDIAADDWKQFNRIGKEQVCAGYVLYGPSTMLVLSTGKETRGYTLDLTHGGYLLTHPVLTIPQKTNEFAINMSNQPYWHEQTQQYIQHILGGDKTYNMRWNAAMVGDVHRILYRGGIFLYPHDKRAQYVEGKLRLLYEAFPMAMLIENAGGEAIDGSASILSKRLNTLHQRVPVILGSKSEVALFKNMN
jgi:fructose-1,6-bisphosphatase I